MNEIQKNAVPPWPTNKNWWDIVETHNKVVDAGAFPVVPPLTGARSITLAMVCAVARVPIPINYRLDTEMAKGVSDHPARVREYLVANRAGVTPKGYANTIKKHIEEFSKVLALDVRDVNDGLEKALELGRVAGNFDKPTEETRNIKKEVVRGEIPTREDVERVLRPRGGEASEDVFKAAVVADFAEKGRTPNPNWWEITKRNLIEWSKKG